MNRGREIAVANTPHFTLIFTVFSFLTRNPALHRMCPHLIDNLMYTKYT